MFGIGMGELMVILVVALLFVGPDKLPDAAKAIGKGIRELRKAADNVKQTVEKDEDMRGAIEQLRSVKRDLEGQFEDMPSIAAPSGRRVGRDSRDQVAKLTGRSYAITKVAPKLPGTAELAEPAASASAEPASAPAEPASVSASESAPAEPTPSDDKPAA